MNQTSPYILHLTQWPAKWSGAMGNTKRAGLAPIKTEGAAIRAGQNGERTQAGPCETIAKRSWKSTVWTLCALVAIIFLMLAMWGRFSQNKTSTVNPTKTPPASRQ
jgi:hypothetical protein